MMWAGKYNAIPIIITNFLPLRSVPRIGIHLFTWGGGGEVEQADPFLMLQVMFYTPMRASLRKIMCNKGGHKKAG